MQLIGDNSLGYLDILILIIRVATYIYISVQMRRFCFFWIQSILKFLGLVYSDFYKIIKK